MISIPAISGSNSNDYEVTNTLAMKSGGGTFIHFFRTSSASVTAGSGSYVSAELVIPSGFTSPGSATLNIHQCAKGTVTQLGSASITGTPQTRTFAYNSAGQLTSAMSPEKGTVTYTYGTNGKVHDKRDAKGQDTV